VRGYNLRVVNPYESPPAPAPAHRGFWRARFRWLGIRSVIIAVASFTASHVIEAAAPDSFYDYAVFLIVRGLVALIALTSMTTTGLFGIGWILSPRSVPQSVVENR
jgi:hypothetical protein